ncbi:DUF1684 domain-containing protein, partial [Streptomyces sp. NPDC005921]
VPLSGTATATSGARGPRATVRRPGSGSEVRGAGCGVRGQWWRPSPAVMAGRELTLQVAEQADGRLWAVFADPTSGHSSYRFRFLYSAAPDADGSTTVDLNRAQLPPCAFADHFICPFPPPGNTLGLAVEAGERLLV